MINPVKAVGGTMGRAIRRIRSRRTLWIASAIVVVVAIIGGIAAAMSGGGDGGGGRPLLITAEAQKRTLTDSVTVKGTAGRVEQRQVQALAPAQVTSVPIEDGADVSAGSPLLSLDGRAAVAVMGDIPFFRQLDVGSHGQDVRQLETILESAGYHPGVIDDNYTNATRTALAQWQAAYHYPGVAPAHAQTVTVSLSPSNGYKVGDQSSAGITIEPSRVSARSAGDAIVFTTASATPVLSIHALSGLVQEGGTATFRIDADSAPAADLSIPITIGGSVGSYQYVAPNGPATLKMGETSTTVAIPIAAERSVEGDRVLTLSMTDGSDYDLASTASSASTTIADDDVPELGIAGGGYVVRGGTTTLTITADQAPIHDIQVGLATTGDARPDRDFSAIDPFAVLRAGTTSTTVNIATLSDDTINDSQRIVVSLAANPAHYRIGPNGQTVVTIAGETALPVVRLQGSATKVQKGQPIPLTLTLSRPLAKDLTVPLAYSGTAREGDDYTTLGRVVVPAGQTSLSLQVPTVKDNRVQSDRELTISLVGATNYVLGEPSAATATIVADNVPELSLVADSTSVRKGGGTTFRIVADQAPVRDISVSYSVIGGSAQAGKDFEAMTGSAVLPAGQTSIVVPLLTIADDVTFEPTDMIAGHWPIRVGQVLVDEGDSVTAGMPLLSLTDSALTVTLHATASDRTRLRTGQKATVTVTGSSDEAEGVITKLDDTAQIDEKTKEQYYEGTVEVPQLDAADGANVSIEVILEERGDVLTVPIAAVKQNGDGQDVVRVLDLEKTGETREVDVKTGISEGSYIEIKSGLQGGEVIIVEVDTQK